MPEQEIELSIGSLRQRRNLLLVAMLLILMHHADISFGSSLTFQGLTLTIGRPEAIHTFLLIMLCYFLWRFYQYFHTDKANANLKGQYRTSRVNMLNQAIRKSVFKQTEYTSLQERFDYNKLKPIDFFTYEYEAVVNLNQDDNHETVTVSIPKTEIEVERIKSFILFSFRGKILTDFYIPYLITCYAFYIQFV